MYFAFEISWCAQVSAPVFSAFCARALVGLGFGRKFYMSGWIIHPTDELS